MLGGILVLISIFTSFSSFGICQKRKSKVAFVTLPVANSPYFNSLELAEVLALRGHEVSILTTKYLKKRSSVARHVDYQVSNEETAEAMNALIGDARTSCGLLCFARTVKNLIELLLDSCFAILRNEDTIKEILEADMLVTISIMPCSFYLADMFDKPIVTLHPASLYVIASMTGAPSLASFVPTLAASLSDEMNFLERTQNFLMHRIKDFVMNFGVTYYFRELQATYGWKSKRSFPELFSRTEMSIIPLDFAYQYANPFMPNTFFVGPLLAKPAKKLPKDLEDFMQSSGEHGVVLLAFGSAACSQNQVTVKRILTAISKMKQKFIWKLKSTGNLTIPSNLMLLKWVPQNDILGHKKTKAFVSHMGINGAAEAAYHGVPIVAAPFLKGERFHNAILFSKKVKMAKFIDIFNANADLWQRTLEEVVYDPSYKEHAVLASRRMRSWPKSSVERAGDLVQYTLDNGGRLPHLKSNANSLYWFQYYCVDVVAFLLALSLFSIYAVSKVFRYLLYTVFRSISSASSKMLRVEVSMALGDCKKSKWE